MWYTNWICSDCGNVFREDEIKVVYTMEGEGCMRGPMHDHDECPYCGSGVVEFNIRTWGFAKIKKS